MTTEQLTTDQRPTNLRLELGRLEAESTSNSIRLDRIETQVSKLAGDQMVRRLDLIESLTEIRSSLARMEVRQSDFASRLDRLENRPDRSESKIATVLTPVIDVMTWALLVLSVIVAIAIFFR